MNDEQEELCEHCSDWYSGYDCCWCYDGLDEEEERNL